MKKMEIVFFLTGYFSFECFGGGWGVNWRKRYDDEDVFFLNPV